MHKTSGSSSPSIPATNVVELAIDCGKPYPFGAHRQGKWMNFAVYAQPAAQIDLIVFHPGSATPLAEVPLRPPVHRTGDVWHVAIAGLPDDIEYGYRTDCRFSHGPRPELLLDPYARALSGAEGWGDPPAQPAYPAPWERLRLRRARVTESDFDWGADQPLNRPLSASIIYELHVRGFTRHPSSGVDHPGTFAGLMEKIPYLQELGITAVELLPITEFEEHDNPRYNPETGAPLHNYWGYHPIGLFALKAAYSDRAGEEIDSFKRLVKALHAAGIEVILDLVLNHTGEGEATSPTWSFRGLDNATYYLVDPETGAYLNPTGCGNTINCNHPVVQDLILDCLRYWVADMHVDGFRLDLASILSRGRDGEPLECPPVLERIALDPILANTKLIAEPWDAAGLYQVGVFPRWGRWAEWNDQYRDDIRRFVKGDSGMVSRLAARLTGSADLYGAYQQWPARSINFVTCHDGFTLADLVMYSQPHNATNGEAGRDGARVDYSWNCGAEGPSSDPEVQGLRRRQVKNMAALLLLSQGVPMLLSGDEVGRTQQGNNNAYCHDSDLTWLNWDDVDRNRDLFDFFKYLIDFRKRYALFQPGWTTASDVSSPVVLTWHGVHVGQPDWSEHAHTLAMQLSSEAEAIDLLLIVNAHWEPHEFELLNPSSSKCWRRFVDTFQAAPNDITPVGDEVELIDSRSYTAGPRSVVILVGRVAL